MQELLKSDGLRKKPNCDAFRKKPSTLIMKVSNRTTGKFDKDIQLLSNVQWWFVRQVGILRCGQRTSAGA